MDFLKVRRFRKSRKPNLEKEQEQARSGNTVASVADSKKADEIEDAEDVDFITNEVKRRLKELRRNSFMVLIPEEDEEGEEEEEEEESYLGEDQVEDKCSSVWRDVVAEGLQWWGGFDAVYEKYCERMLFFDRLSSHQHKETGNIKLLAFFSYARIVDCLYHDSKNWLEQFFQSDLYNSNQLKPFWFELSKPILISLNMLN